MARSVGCYEPKIANRIDAHFPDVFVHDYAASAQLENHELSIRHSNHNNTWAFETNMRIDELN